MAIIPNFPEELLYRHEQWHQSSAGAAGGRIHPVGTTGGGTEFLHFYRELIAAFHGWFDSQPFGTAPFNKPPFDTAASARAAVAGWTSIPAALKNPAVTGWSGVQIAQEARLTTLSPQFGSEDELGNYIELGIAWFHLAAAAAFGENEVRNRLQSPRSTYFYGIHGLVDNWWTRWHFSLIIIKSEADFRSRAKAIKDLTKEGKELVLEKNRLPEKLNVLEVPIPGLGAEVEGAAVLGSDALSSDVLRRLTDLETTVGQQAFIRAAERPEVGEAARQKSAEAAVEEPSPKGTA